MDHILIFLLSCVVYLLSAVVFLSARELSIEMGSDKRLRVRRVRMFFVLFFSILIWCVSVAVCIDQLWYVLEFLTTTPTSEGNTP